jgi:D-alanyl-lipoteichoic acid acyltransferase DltB (MBOAT superfamily)
MLFNSVQFALFFAIVYAGYRMAGHRAQNWLLLAASYYFYAAWDWRFTGLLAASTLVSYGVALRLARAGEVRARRRLLWAGVGFHLVTLAFFKYYGFFVANLSALFESLGIRSPFLVLSVVLPLGISFYTFMAIAYLVDVYRREIEPSRDLVEFALFISYFPHLIAGPILRAPSLLPQIARPRVIRPQDLSEGLWLTAIGLFKKMVVADNLAPIVDAVFAPDRAASGGEILIGVYAFALQIYGDFSGYSDVARGVSQLMGIELNVNFRFPYFVRTPREFWRHWHISLSTWLRDYLFIPLGGSRGGRLATHRNLFVTMLLGGLWHGAAWTFVAWGAYQGVLLAAHREIEARFGRFWPTRRVAGGLAGVFAWLVMCHLTCYGWLLFRATGFDQIVAMSASLARFSWTEDAGVHALSVVGYGLPLMLLNAYEWWKDDLLAVVRLPLVPRYAVYGALFYLIVIFGQYGGAQFIYFQF